MTPPQVLQILENKNRMLTQRNDEYIELAENRAQAERDYRQEVRKEVLLHKSDGHPATLIPTLVAGVKFVSELKFKMDVAEAMVKANTEACKTLINQIDSARSMLAWLKAELTRS